VCILCFCLSYCIYVLLLSAQWGGPNEIEAQSLGPLFLQESDSSTSSTAASGSMVGFLVDRNVGPNVQIGFALVGEVGLGLGLVLGIGLGLAVQRVRVIHACCTLRHTDVDGMLNV